MKFLTSLPLLVALGVSLTGCNTLVTRRELFSPTRGSGPYTKAYVKMRDQEGLVGVSRNTYHKPGPQEGYFGVSHNVLVEPGENEGIFGISHNEPRDGF